MHELELVREFVFFPPRTLVAFADVDVERLVWTNFAFRTFVLASAEIDVVVTRRLWSRRGVKRYDLWIAPVRFAAQHDESRGVVVPHVVDIDELWVVWRAEERAQAAFVSAVVVDAKARHDGWHLGPIVPRIRAFVRTDDEL